jgi:cytochrome P450
MEYVADIRTMTLNILNVLVTRQRPKIMLRSPKYKKAKARVNELGQRMIIEAKAAAQSGAKAEEDKNLIDDIMAAHLSNPRVMPDEDLVLTLTGPYVAGLDTVANTTAAFIYAVLKHPEILARVQQEADALFADGDITDDDLKRIPSVRYALMETMRLYPIAVAQMRTATRDVEFAGHTIKAGEMLFIGTSVPHFLEELYPDPQRFDIDRYPKPRAEHLQPGAYSPYGRGQHTCLGKTFADVQMALSMARLFHKLDLELESPDYTLATKTAPTPGPAMSFKVRVKGYRN